MSIIIKMEIENIRELGDVLYAGALERWKSASFEQRQAVYDRLESYCDAVEIDSGVLNDIVWFECDVIFYPEEFDDDENDDDENDDD